MTDIDSLKSTEKRLLPLKRDGVFRAVIFYPGTYYTGMSSLALQGLYRTVNSHKQWLGERWFSDCCGKYTFDNEFLVSDSDLVLVTLPYEPCLENVLSFLERFSIPRDPLKRHKEHPFIVTGGSVTCYNPRLALSYSDLVISGDGEQLLKRVLDLLPELHNNRPELRRAFSAEPNAATPENPVSEARFPSCSLPWTSSIIAKQTEFSEMFLVELSRGCPFSCPFCVTGNTFGKVRHFRAGEIIEAVQSQPCRKVGFIAPSPLDHPEIEQLVAELDGYDISFSSFRIDTLKNRPSLRHHLRRQGAITIGLESGSSRLRQLIGKNENEGLILDFLQEMHSAGVHKLKLYSMYGLPGEQDQDLHDLITLLKKVEEFWKKGKITVSLNAFVPMPGTPWGKHEFDRKILKKKERFLKGLFSKSNLKRTLPSFESLRLMERQYNLAHSGSILSIKDC